MTDSKINPTKTTAAVCDTILDTQQRARTKWIWKLHYHFIPNVNTLKGGEMHI